MTVKEFYYEDLKWCGCGDPQGDLIFLRDILKLYRDRAANGCDKWAEVTELIKVFLPWDCRLADAYLKVLTSHDLLEHGSGVHGSWLTEKGQEILTLLENGIPDDL